MNRPFRAALVRMASLLILIMCIFPSAAAAEKGEKSFGVRVGYMSRNNSAAAGLDFTYAFSRHFRVAPELGVVFRNEDKDALTVDLDFHFPLSLPGKVDFYPIVGLGFNSWNIHGVDAETHDDVTTHTNCLGLNAGAGLEIRPSGSLKLTLEARYTLIRHYPNAMVTAGIAFLF